MFGKGYEVMHAFGHSLGLEIHEVPTLRTNTDQTIKKDMIFAIEPGIYLEGKFGIRIEDTFLITQNECINLTKCSKDYIKLMLKS